MDTSQHYKLQLALEGGTGFEMITTLDPVGFKSEMITAASAGRFAEVVHTNPDLASLAFNPRKVIGFQMTPVSRLVATGQMPGPRMS